jgi:hypothetical protein
LAFIAELPRDSFAVIVDAVFEFEVAVMVLFPSFEAVLLERLEDVDAVADFRCEADAAVVVVPDEIVFRCAPETP